MNRWEVTVGAWRELDRRHVACPPVCVPREVVTIQVALDLEERLADGGAVALGPTRFVLSDSHADLFIRDRAVLLAECRALVLRHPSPFPRLDLFPRLARAARRLHLGAVS